MVCYAFVGAGAVVYGDSRGKSRPRDRQHAVLWNVCATMISLPVITTERKIRTAAAWWALTASVLCAILLGRYALEVNDRESELVKIIN